MPYSECNFTVDLKEEFPFLNEKNDGRRKVFCTVCRSSFSNEHGGRSDVLQYTVGGKKTNLLHRVESPHKGTRRFLKVKKKDMGEQLRPASEEGVFV
jgi:adenine-specific DNA methylase